MKLPRRSFLHLAVGATALPTVSRIATAQTIYPSRPITMIVSFPAGGGQDAVARLLAERFRGSLGQPVIVANISGADGSIGTGRAARARPDGYTIDLGSIGTHVQNGALYSLSYHVLNDFAPISPVARFLQVLLARNTMPAKDLNELIAWLKANPNKASAGVPALANRLQATFFQKETGTHFSLAPYRGGATAMQDLVAGQIDLAFGTSDALPLVRAGSVKAYALTSDRRLALAPDVPTFAEMGLPTLSYSAWLGIFAPRLGTRRRTSSANLIRWSSRHWLIRPCGHGLSISEARSSRATSRPRRRIGALVKTDAEKWWPLIKEFGIRAE
jgi:tripartite-type tricarboxylate transporter receptor subunit TctC